MEDSARRRERLMALRTEASQSSGAPPDVSSQGVVELPDPVFSSSPFQAETLSPPPRFDYYTNPTAAFSASHSLNKRKSSSFQSPSPTSTTYARPNVWPRNYTGPSQPSMHQVRPQSDMPPNAQPPSYWRCPVQFQPPPPGNIRPPFSGPGSWQPSSGSSLHMPYTNPPRGGFTNPHFVRGGRPGSSSGPRPSPNSYSNSYSGSRGTGGRGLGFHSRFGQSDYYSQSMVGDPWIELEPIVGNLLESLDWSGPGSGFASASGSHSWLPESLRKKESTKPDKTGNKYEKKLSLAEYLDLSINQTIDET